ncbi:MAG: leucine-rich repeat protein [Oscillospiraceae bacterium]|nr:leucine-rich repeat protein [Oscillospiraceae bacterium]
MKKIITVVMSLCIATNAFSVVGYTDSRKVSAETVYTDESVEEPTAKNDHMNLLSYSDHAVLISCCRDVSGAVVVPAAVGGVPVTEINIGAFTFCEGLTGVTLPDSLTDIAASAFYSCTGLKSVVLPDSMKKIESSVFWGCTGLESVTFPKSLEEIKVWAFYGCSGLKEVNFPKSLKKIGPSVFFGCNDLVRVVIPDAVTVIEELTFAECKGLKEVMLPESVTSIEYMAFYECSKLETINIPDSVTEIGDKAFYGCEDLTIYCSENSFARRYAEENGIKYSEKQSDSGNEKIVNGDVNADDVLNTADFIDIIRMIISQTKSSTFADINKDGNVDASDLMLLKKILAK